MTDRLSGIAAFVAAVETGGFSLAGERLGLSRSAVGKTVARLEARLGVRLIHRTTRSLRLTEDGQVFYERARRALAELEAAEASLATGHREPAGRLRVTAPVLFGRRCVAPVLVELARRNPKLALQLAFTDRPVEVIEEGFDLAIRNTARPNGAGLMSRRLATQCMMVCAAPSYLEARGRPATVEDLATHDAVVYCRGGRDRPWAFPDGRGGERQPPIVSRVRFDDLEAIADAAAAGMGLAWLPCWLIADRVRSGELVRVLEDVPGLMFDTYALWPQAPHLPLRVRLAIDTLADRLPGMM